MGTVTVLQLPQATSLTGAESVETTQNGRSVRVTTAQIADLAPLVIPVGAVGVISAALQAGGSDNYNAGGAFDATIGFIDLTLVTASNITGLQAGFDGQVVVITNVSVPALTLNALSNGSTSQNQFRMPADLILTMFNSQPFKYSASIGKWVML